MRRRCRHDIYADVLYALSRRGPMRITRLALWANMPVDRARRVLDRMKAVGLVSEADGVYRIEPRGYQYLALLERVRSLLGEGGELSGGGDVG